MSASTVYTGLQAQCNATGVTHNSHPPGVGLEFSVSGMKLVYNIITISRGGTYQDVLEKFLTNNQQLAPFVDVCVIGRRIDELYQQHCEAIPNIAYHSDWLMHTSLYWISENKHGYNGYFKYIIFTYKTPNGSSMVYKYRRVPITRISLFAKQREY